MRTPVVLFAVVGCLGFVTSTVTAADALPETIRVMSFNMWHGGDAGRQAFEQTVALVRQSRADVVGLQETAGLAPAGQARPDHGAKLAQALGWHYLDQGERTGIISRFKIVASTPRKWGAKLELPSGREVYLFNAHLAHAPYQPYQLLNIPYHNGAFLTTADEAIQAAKDARGGQIERMLAEVHAIRSEGLPVFLTGDFNEPSHLDWTPAAVKANRCPLEVTWPSTKAVTAAGFLDAYRTVHPDPVQHPGWTWTPITKPTDPKDRHDRIDFVFVSGAKTKVKGAMVVGEHQDYADTVVTPYPSDHRAVVAEVELATEGNHP